MASSLKLSELPVASSLISDDVFLVADVTNSVSKRITFETLNTLLSFEDLQGYQTYVTDTESFQDQIDLLRGDGSLIHSLSDMDEIVTNLQDTIEGVRLSLTSTINTLRDNVDLEILNRNSIDQAVLARTDELEDSQLQHGFATGYLFIQEFQGGYI